MNVIIGQAHFIKTVEDLHEVLAGVSSQLRFGIAFCGVTGPAGPPVRQRRRADRAWRCAPREAIGAGHCFVIMLREGFPVNVLNQVKAVPEVCTVFCATANPVQMVVVAAGEGRGVAGVIDGLPPVGVETDADVAARHQLLRDIGYKL